MISVNTHAASMNAEVGLSKASKTLQQSMTKLGTGFRVNIAMDDAAGLQIATRLNAQTRGIQMAQRNTQNAVSMLQT